MQLANLNCTWRCSHESLSEQFAFWHHSSVKNRICKLCITWLSQLSSCSVSSTQTKNFKCQWCHEHQWCHKCGNLETCGFHTSQHVVMCTIVLWTWCLLMTFHLTSWIQDTGSTTDMVMTRHAVAEHIQPSQRKFWSKRHWKLLWGLFLLQLKKCVSNHDFVFNNIVHSSALKFHSMTAPQRSLVIAIAFCTTGCRYFPWLAKRHWWLLRI